MDKLKLDLDALTVDAFATAEEEDTEHRGTVRGAMAAGTVSYRISCFDGCVTPAIPCA